MSDVIWSIVLSSMLYASVASVLSVTVKEFGLFNLAAGPILIIGGWAGAWIASGFSGDIIGINPWYFAVLLVPLVLQVFSPVMLKDTIKKIPTAYMFISIGAALLIEAVGQNRLQSSAGLTIPLQPTSSSNYVALGAGGLALVVAEVIVRSRRWAETVLEFRAAALGAAPWKEIGRLILIEFVLLLLIGACGWKAHKGEFGAAPYLTIIPLLAVLISKGRPLRAFLLCGGVSLATSLLTLVLPALAHQAVTGTILILGVSSVLSSGISMRPSEIAPSGSSPEPISRWSISRVHTYWMAPFMGLLALVALYSPILFKSYHLATGASTLNGYLVPLLWVILAWAGQNYLGVESVCWPIMAGTFAYGWAFSGDSIPWVLAISIFLFGIWLFYFSLLRALAHRSRLILDLTVGTALYEAVANSPLLSGVNNNRQVTWLATVEDRLPTGTTLLLTLSLALFWLSFLLTSRKYLRGTALSLVNPRFGIRQGFSFYGPFLVFASTAILAIIVGESFNQLTVSSVTPDRLLVSQGLAILLLGSIMRFAGGLAAIAIVFIVYFLMVALYAPEGATLNMWISACFVILGLSARKLYAPVAS